MIAYDPTDRFTVLTGLLSKYLADDGVNVWLSEQAPKGYDKLFAEWDELRKEANKNDDGLDW